MVAPDVWCGELAQNVLGLMEGHQTHAKQGEAETRSRTEKHYKVETFSFLSDSRLRLQKVQNVRGTDHVKMSVTTQKVSSQLGPGTT